MTEAGRSAGVEQAGKAQVRVFLFADIRGYTRFTQEQGDEAAARAAAEFAAIARTEVAKHEGTVTELRGDEALAVFSSAREALRAATDLQAAFAAARTEDPSLPFHVGIGLDAGEALPVEGGYRGGALNLAARLCSLAAADEVLASEGVTHLARKLEGISYVERGVATLKGFSDSIRIVEIVTDEAPAADALPTLREEKRLPIGGFLGALPGAPIVGRATELRQILDAVDAVAGGAGRLIVLAGEPGVGKTRLAQEVTLNVRNRDFLLATGRCYESHRTLPFYPFLDALALAYASCPESIRKMVPSRWPHLGRLLPDAGIQTPSGVEPQEEQQRLFRAVTGFLQAIAAERPVALFIDDLHWMDAASLELLQHLARHTRADRVLMLGTYRDVEIDRRHPLEAALRDLTREDLVDRVPVRRLAREDTAAFMAAQFGGEEISDEFRDVVYERTEGNAFFVQHVLRVLVERGDVFRRGDRWTRKDLADIEVPESVRSVIAQRLTQLSPETQEILREASVLGQTVGFDELLAMGDRNEDELDRALDEAQTHGLVREVGADQVAFDHALTQQALYQELTARRRRRLHLAAGEAIEGLPERQRTARAGELAWHFLHGGDQERAVKYSLLAARHAEAAYAIADAENQYATALEIAQEIGDEEAEVQIRGLRGALRLDKFAGKGAAGDFDRMLDLARRHGNSGQEVKALIGLGRAFYVIALDATDIAAAAKSRELYDEGYRLAEQIGDKTSMVRALLGSRWFTDFWPEYHEQSIANRKEALAISEELGNEDLILESKLALWRAMDRETAEKWTKDLARTLSERGDFHRLNEHCFVQMWAYRDWGEFERAIEACDEGVRVASEIGVPPVQYFTLKAMSLADLGRFQEAWEALRQEVADVEHPFGQAMQMLGAGYILVQLGWHGRALEVLSEADRLAKQVKRAWMQGWISELRGQALSRGGTMTKEQADELRAEIERLQWEGDPGLSEILVASGQLEEALERSSRAEAAAREHASGPILTDVLITGGRALLGLDRTGEARAKLTEARQLAARMQAVPRLQLAETVWSEVLRALGDEEGAREAKREAERLLGAMDDPSSELAGARFMAELVGSP